MTTTAEASVIRAGILTRVSTHQQVETLSLADQKTRCEELARRISAEVGRPVAIENLYEDKGISGDGVSERPALERALSDVDEERIDLLLAYDVDRLSRNMGQLQDIISRISDAGARLQFVVTPLQWDEEEGELHEWSEMLYNLKSIQARMEWRTIKRRTIRGRLSVVAQGLQPQRSIAPYGYHIWQHWQVQAGQCSADQVGRYAIVEETAVVVRRIFEMAAGGNMGTCKIAHTLNAEGIPSPGHPLHPEARKWYPSQVYNTLKNPLYVGHAFFGKTKTRKDKRREAHGRKAKFAIAVDRTLWKHLEAPAIVDDETWTTANANIAARRGRIDLPGDPSRRYLWTGILRCPDCGGSMVGYKAHTGREQDRGRYLYYVCATACLDHATKEHEEGAEGRRCPGGRRCLRLPDIEKSAALALATAVNHPSYIQTAVQEYLHARMVQASTYAPQKERERLAGLLAKEQQRLRGLQEALAVSAAAGVDTSHPVKLIGECGGSIRRLREALEALPEARKAADVLPSPREAAERVRMLLSRIPEALAAPREVVSVERMREMIGRVVQEARPVVEKVDGPTASGKPRQRVTYRVVGVDVTLSAACVWGESGSAFQPRSGIPQKPRRLAASPDAPRVVIRALLDGSVSVHVANQEVQHG